LIVVPAWSRPDIRFIWNASASVPIGLYRIVPGNHVDVTDLAVVMPPAELAAFLDERRYLPRGLPLISACWRSAARRSAGAAAPSSPMTESTAGARARYARPTAARLARPPHAP
jgi:hypothetical protein